jgi:hypothetical protein
MGRTGQYLIVALAGMGCAVCCLANAPPEFLGSSTTIVLILGVSLVGAVVVVGQGTRAAKRQDGRTPNRCPRCGYDLTGIPPGLCPECGREDSAGTSASR